MTICSSNSTPGYIPGINENTNSKRNMDLNAHGFTVYNSQDMEATQVPINRWLAYEDTTLKKKGKEKRIVNISSTKLDSVKQNSSNVFLLV